jgi:hypothetical protein
LRFFPKGDIVTVEEPLMNAVKPVKEALGLGHDEECPICAAHIDPETGNPRFNAKTLAAMQEARDIMSGKIPAKWYHSIEEAREDLGV